MERCVAEYPDPKQAAYEPMRCERFPSYYVHNADGPVSKRRVRAVCGDHITWAVGDLRGGTWTVEAI